MVSSQLPHFSSLMLTAIQRGAFGGLLPGYEGMGGRPAKRVARAVRPAKPAKPVKPAKPARSACRKVFLTDDSDDTGDAGDADDSVPVPPKFSKSEEKGGEPVITASKVCLRCSKRLDQAGESTSRGKTVPTGFRCDLGKFRKCSYCAHGHHDCEEVSWSPAFSRLC